MQNNKKLINIIDKSTIDRSVEAKRSTKTQNKLGSKKMTSPVKNMTKNYFNLLTRRSALKY